MIPPCNAQGDLPPGVYQATLVEVVEHFGQGAPEHLRMTERLQQVIALAQGTGKLEQVFIEQLQIRRDGGRHGIVEVLS